MNKTNIEFEVKDTYEKTSYGTCDYHLVDNYYEQALMKYITEFNDLRVKLDTHMSSSDIKVDYESLNSYKKTSTHTYNIKGSYLEEYFYENSDYIKDVITSVYGKTKYYNFN